MEIQDPIHCFQKHSITTRIKTCLILRLMMKYYTFESIPLQQGLRRHKTSISFRASWGLSKAFHYNKD